MKGRLFSGLVKPKSPMIQLHTFQNLTGCSTKCISMDKEFGEIVVDHGSIDSEHQLYDEIKKQDSLVKQSVLLIKFQNVLPPQASALVVLMDFSEVGNSSAKHQTIFDMAMDIMRSHCSHLHKPARRRFD